MTNLKIMTCPAERTFKALKLEKIRLGKKSMTALDLLKDYDYIFLFMDDSFLINEMIWF